MAFWINNGIYFVGLALGVLNKGTYDSFYEKDALSFSIIEPIEETLYDLRNGYSGVIPGPVRPQLDWKITKLEWSYINLLNCNEPKLTWYTVILICNL